MAKYENDVKQLLKLIGGKENIQAVSHCMTRMRFVLVDPKKADEKAIEEIPAVKGTFTQAGQYQVIIGNDVSVFYNEFTSYAGIEGVSKEAAKAAAKTNQNVVQKMMGALGEIFAPLIPALICGGLILGFRNIIGEINFSRMEQRVWQICISSGRELIISCGSLERRYSICCQWALYGLSQRRWVRHRFLVSS